MKKTMWMCMAIVILAMCAMPMAAQDIYGSINGTVTDSSGAAVTNATVTVTNVNQNIVVRTLTTDANGLYSALDLIQGTYKVTVVAKGFKKEEVKSIVLDAVQRLSINVKLQVGGSNETVEVTANELTLDTRTSEIGTTLSASDIAEIQTPNRNVVWFVQLAPGVTYGGGDSPYIGNSLPSGTTNTQAQSANGARNSMNNWMVDGADNVDRGSNQTLLMYPSIDAIQEVRIQTGSYSAEYGRGGGAQVNVITKSGTNRFHGSAYEFFQNDYLNADNALNRQSGLPTDKERYNDFGYSIGGPVFFNKKNNNKTFFFFSQELRRIIKYAVVSAQVPTAAEKTGVFQNSVCAGLTGGNGPAFSTTCPVGNITHTVTVISPLAAALVKDVWSGIPVPNVAGTHTLNSSLRNLYNFNSQIARIDHTFNNKYSAWFRFENDIIPTTEAGGLFTGSALPGVSVTQTQDPGKAYLAHYTAVFSPTFVMDLGYHYSFGAILSDPIGSDARSISTDVVTALASTMPYAVSLNRIPTFSYTSGASSVTGFGQYRDYNRNHNWLGNFTKVHGNHTFKFGFSYDRYNKNENTAGNNTGSFGFTTTASQPLDPANVGVIPASFVSFEQTWANFLGGYASSFSQSSIDVTADMHQFTMEWFAQDEWKVRNNVTLTLGVRQTYFQSPYDGNNELTNFSPSAYSASVAAATGGISVTTGNFVTPPSVFTPYLNGIIVNAVNAASFPGATVSPFGASIAPSNKTNFAPRLGLNWAPNEKTTVRGGFGTYFDSTLLGIYEQNIFANPPFILTPSYSSITVNTPTGSAAAASATPKTLHGSTLSNATPYTQNWNLNVQRELGTDFILDIGYVGSNFHHLLDIVDINQPAYGLYATTPGLLTAGNTIITSANGLTPRLNAIRPYQGWGPINMLLPIAGGNFNSFQANLTKRFTHGYSVVFNYTWSHALGDDQTDRSTAPQSTANFRADYGPLQLDRRHVFNARFIYDLPIFKNRHDFAGIVFGNWQASGLFYAYTGLPLTITDGTSDPAGIGVLSASASSGRPNVVANPNGPKSSNISSAATGQTWFNTSAFAIPCINNVGVCAYLPGNSPRGIVRGPGYYKQDFAMAKNFKFAAERYQLQLRAEAYNLFNHDNPNAVSTALSSATFGHITSFRDPRTMQLAAHFTF